MEKTMPIHPEIEEHLQSTPQVFGDPTGIPPEIMRQFYEAIARPGPEVFSVKNHVIEEHDIPIRIYYPTESATPLPAIMYFHGGGWVIGSLETHDEQCRSMANATEAIVISVDYRLAPEHPFPAAPNDCYTATCWVADNAEEIGIDASRLAVAGDSAGGNLAAVVSQIARDEKKPEIVFQALIYPAVDIDSNRWPSYRENENAPILTKALMEWFFQHYVGGTTFTHDPLAAPIRTEDLSNLPPCYIATAEFDPLRDEGMAYADLLREAGVQVEAKCFEGLIHAFSSLGAEIDVASKARAEIFQALKRALS